LGSFRSRLLLRTTQAQVLLSKGLKDKFVERGSEILRITVSHTKSKEEVMRAVDRSFDDLFQGIGMLPLQFVSEQRRWQGSTLIFVVSAKMGIISTPIKGTIEVTEKELTIDVDLGLLERLIPQAKTREAISSRVRGLLT
jgi:Putative polyhydroxyalkanoic acid system protein (PHA_gran_rgn)